MKNIKTLFLVSSSTLLLFGFSGASAAQDDLERDTIESSTDSQPPPPSEPNTEHLETIVVTGTRLGVADYSSHMETITGNDIKEMGVSTVTELLERLPQNLSNVNTMGSRFGLNDASFGDPDSSSHLNVNSLGVSSANLRGAGAGNTLVLIDGRRIAGAAGLEDGFVNLGGIPLSSIERVDIVYDGASSIYGSDALGGVINFITKKNYTGASFDTRYDYGANGGDRMTTSGYVGRTWDTGSLSLSAEYREVDSVTNADAGWTTRIHCDRWDNAQCDTRSAGAGDQPGLISVSTFNPVDFSVAETIYSLSPGTDASSATADDVVIIDQQDLRDYVPLGAAEENETYSFTLNLDQEIFDGFTLHGSALYSKSENHLDGAIEPLQLLVSTDNPYFAGFRDLGLNIFDPWDSGTFAVTYAPIAEVADGRLSGPVYSERDSESQTITVGFDYEFLDDFTLSSNYTYSKSTSNGHSRQYRTLAEPRLDWSNPNGPTLSCGPRSEREQVLYGDLIQEQCNALMSSDPDVAFNPFNDGSSTAGADPSLFFTETYQADNTSISKHADIALTGAVANLPAGALRVSVGGEWRTKVTDSEYIRRSTYSEPESDNYAAFVEMQVPIFGGQYTRNGFQILTLNASARYDRTDSEGAVATVDDIRISEGGEPIYGSSSFSRVSPAIGINWVPTPSLSLRARWSTGFKAPSFTQLYNVNARNFTTFVGDDPYFPGFNEVERIGGGNRELEPETSTTLSAGIRWVPTEGALLGWDFSANYTDTEIKNGATTFDQLRGSIPETLLYSLDEIIARDPATNQILSIDARPFNIATRNIRSYELQAARAFDTEFGFFRASADYFVNLEQSRTVVPGADSIDTVGLREGLDEYQLVGTLNYNYEDVFASLRVEYTPSHNNDIGVAGEEEFQRVDSMTITDLTARYFISNQLSASIGAFNLFNTKPPFSFTGNGAPYDPTRWDTRGRVIYFNLSYEI